MLRTGYTMQWFCWSCKTPFTQFMGQFLLYWSFYSLLMQWLIFLSVALFSNSVLSSRCWFCHMRYLLAIWIQAQNMTEFLSHNDNFRLYHVIFFFDWSWSSCQKRSVVLCRSFERKLKRIQSRHAWNADNGVYNLNIYFSGLTEHMEAATATLRYKLPLQGM